MQELLLNVTSLLHKLLRVQKDRHDHFLRFPSSKFGPKNGIRSDIFIGHTVCCWRTIYQTAPIITVNVRRPLGNTVYDILVMVTGPV